MVKNRVRLPRGTGRDLRVDFARGLANWLMLLDHIPHDAADFLTLRNFGFSGAAELFALSSSYGVALLFGRMMIERGFVIAATRIFRRVWQLYAAHLVLFVVYITGISLVAAHYAATDIFEQYHITRLLSDPIGILTDGVLMQARPLNLEMLEMAIILLAVFPLILASLLRWPHLTMLGSVGLYVTARQFDINFPADQAEDAVNLNPLCWQLLFVLGGYLAIFGEILISAVRKVWSLRALAMLFLVFSFLVEVGDRIPVIQDIYPGLPIHSIISIDRENLGVGRILHVLCITVLFVYFIPADWKGFESRLVLPIVKCGEEWLACFCVGIFLALAAHMVLITSQDTPAFQIFVYTVVLMLMTAVAYYVSWSRHQDQISKPSVQSRSDHATANK